MNTIGFYDFDVTAGSSIQAEALFNVFDDLTSIINGKRSSADHSGEHINLVINVKAQKKGYP